MEHLPHLSPDEAVRRARLVTIALLALRDEDFREAQAALEELRAHGVDLTFRRAPSPLPEVFA